MNNIQVRMKQLGISASSLSKRLGISKRDMKHFLKYPGEMDCFAYYELCKVLSIDFDNVENCILTSTKYKVAEFLRLKYSEWKESRFKKSLMPYHRIFEVTNKRMAGLDIQQGDIIVCDTRKRPSKCLKDIIVYSTKSTSCNLGVYWGRYVGHWAIDSPEENRAYHSWIEGIVGVVCAVYDAEYKMKWERNVNSLPIEIQDTENTIQREPSNLGGMCGKNLSELEI